MEAAINIQGLSKNFNDFKLNDVSICVPQGSIVGFIGENGAGKSTTIKAMLGLISRTGGSVDILGMNIDEHEKEIKEQIGVVFDASHFHDNLTTKDISKVMSHIYSNWDDDLFRQYLHTFSLPENKIIKEFSKGMQMKLCIAAALAHHPKLLILDEATSGLDPVVREEILDIFLDFIQNEQHTIFISSHITSDLDKIADYIIFIHQGSIVFSRGKDDLIEQMGVLKCGGDAFSGLDKSEVVRYRKGKFGYEVLIDDRYKFISQNPSLVVDRTTIEEIMLFYVRGEKL